MMCHTALNTHLLLDAPGTAGAVAHAGVSSLATTLYLPPPAWPARSVRLVEVRSSVSYSPLPPSCSTVHATSAAVRNVTVVPSRDNPSSGDSICGCRAHAGSAAAASSAAARRSAAAWRCARRGGERGGACGAAAAAWAPPPRAPRLMPPCWRRSAGRHAARRPAHGRRDGRACMFARPSLLGCCPAQTTTAHDDRCVTTLCAGDASAVTARAPCCMAAADVCVRGWWRSAAAARRGDANCKNSGPVMMAHRRTGAVRSRSVVC
jgi:hypothetical protein